MNTATIPIRSSLSTVIDLFAPEPVEHRALYTFRDLEDHTEPPAALQFEHDVERFQRAVGRQRDAARSAIVKKLLAADDPDEHIQTAVRTLVSSARPGRLDDAVDILSECRRLLPQFVCEVLSQPQTTEIDEDYWYALIRGMGKSTLPSARMFVELLWSKSPEAAVEALGDIGDDESLNRLRAVAAGDRSDFVCQLAAEILEECSE
jgi:hypothetical protein